MINLKKIENDAPKVSELVMEALLSAMESGMIKVGQELPSERDLSATLGVGRGSLRECMAILEYLHIIEVQGNRKIVVKDAFYFKKAVDFIRISVGKNTLNDSVEFRRAVEVYIVRLACERATEPDYEKMRDALKRMDVNIYDHKADIDFHQALALASHNVILAATMELFSSVLMDIRVRYYKLPKYHQRTLQSHHRIYEAVADRDPDRAAAEMEDHLNLVTDFTKEATELGIGDD